MLRRHAQAWPDVRSASILPRNEAHPGTGISLTLPSVVNV
jgi:hypothetical protein